MAEVTVLGERKKSPNQDLIRILEELTERAKSGELRGAFIIQEYVGDVFDDTWALDDCDARYWRCEAQERVDSFTFWLRGDDA